MAASTMTDNRAKDMREFIRLEAAWLFFGQLNVIDRDDLLQDAGELLSKASDERAARLWPELQDEENDELSSVHPEYLRARAEADAMAAGLLADLARQPMTDYLLERASWFGTNSASELAKARDVSDV